MAMKLGMTLVPAPVWPAEAEAWWFVLDEGEEPAGAAPGVLPPEEGWAPAAESLDEAFDGVELPPAEEKLPPVQPSIVNGPANASSGDWPSSNASKKEPKKKVISY